MSVSFSCVFSGSPCYEKGQFVNKTSVDEGTSHFEERIKKFVLYFFN